MHFVYRITYILRYEKINRLIYKEVNIKSGLYILRRYENYIFVVFVSFMHSVSKFYIRKFE